MSTDRVQVAQCLMTQLFDDYNCESCNVADNQHLENVHNEGRVKLSQILATNDKLRLINLSVEQLSSQEYHKAMCEILEGFFKGIDDALPPPTIIQVQVMSLQQILTLILNIDYSRFSKVYLN